MFAFVPAILLLLLLLAVPAHAQTTPTLVQVFVSRTVTEGGTVEDTVSFVDVLTGQTSSVVVFGERFTVAGDNVLFYDLANNRVALIAPDGTVQPHPFIQPGTNTRRVDWVVSNDNQLLAWTLTEATGSDAITTVTTVANIDGTEPQQVLVDGPRQGIRALPVAFSMDDTVLYMDYQPDLIGMLTPYDEYAGLFAVSLKDGNAVNLLLGEPGCYCGAGFGGGQFVRLAAAEEGFDVRLYDVSAQVSHTVDGVRLPNFTQGGDVLVSPDGTRAIYAVAQVQEFGSPAQVVRTVFVLLDINSRTQRQLTQPQTLYIRPVAWTENNTAVIFTSPNREGTWKMNIETGLLEQIASARYVGALTP